MLILYAAGDPQNFTINVAPQADFPIDLYILMDLTASQQDALNSVTNAIDDIGKYCTVRVLCVCCGHLNIQ